MLKLISVVVILFGSLLASAAADADNVLDLALIKQIETVGEKNIKLWETINSSRPDSKKITLPNRKQESFTPASPLIVSARSLRKDLAEIKAKLPASIADVLFGTAAMTPTLRISDEEYAEFVLAIDRLYSSARKLSLGDRIGDYSVWDVRGYLKISQDSEIDQKLDNWSKLSTAQKEQLIPALLQMCYNYYSFSMLDLRGNVWGEFYGIAYVDGYISGCMDANPSAEDSKYAYCTEYGCRTSKGDGFLGLKGAIASNKVKQFKNTFLPWAKANYENFFKILRPRKDVVWNSSNSLVMTLPFANPHKAKVLELINSSLESNYSLKGWKLQLNIVESKKPELSHVRFEENEWPHLDRYNPSELVMDSRFEVSSPFASKMIAREIGHLLGFHDCDLEFYEASTKSYVYYRVDPTSIMCNLDGEFKESHFNELKRVYYK